MAKYTPADYLSDRAAILAELNNFAKLYPREPLSSHTGVARLEGIAREYRDQS